MISKFSVKKPYTVLVGVVLVLVLGYVSLTRMTTDLLPDMDLPYALIMTADTGASPEEVEQDVSAPIEAAMATTANIKNISSTSYNSYSMVILEYEQDTNMDSALIEIQQNLDQLSGSWDDSVGSPMIMQIDPDMMPVMVAAADVKDMTQEEISEYVTNQLVPAIESVEGVADVTESGALEQSVQVTMNQKKIDKLNKKIQKKINAQFKKAQETLNDSSSEIEDSQSKLESGQDDLANQISSSTNEIINNKIELSEKETKLASQLADLKENKTSLSAAIKSLQDVYDTAVDLESGIENLTKVHSNLTQVRQGAVKTLLAKNKKATTAQQKSAGDAAVKTALKSVNKETGYNFTSEDDVSNALDSMQKNMDKINASLKEQNESFEDSGVSMSTYKDIPKAVSTLSANLTKVNAGIAQIESAQEQVEAGKVSLDEALETINQTQINSVLEMSDAASQLSEAASQVESGQAELDSSKTAATESSDLNTILSIDNLNNILTAQNFEMPAGYAGTDDEQYLVSVGEEVSSVEDLQQLVLLDLGIDGIDAICLSDVADVQLVDEDEDSYTRVNGNPAIMLSIEKQTGYSTGDVTSRLKDKFAALEKDNKQLNLSILMNQGVYIDTIVDSVIQNMIVGAILAVIVLLLFLKDIRPTLVIACSIPLSVVFAIVLMYFTNISLNMISLSGLALGIGMLVDNSIVVIENIYRLRKEGLSVKKASVEGAKQVAGAIVASTITTVCVFAPIIFTDGITRQLFVDIALTIAYTLGASLLIALTFVPMMSAGLLKNTKDMKSKLFDRVKELYAKVLRITLRFKPVVFLVVIVLLGLSAKLALSKGFSFMDMDMETDEISVTIEPKEDQELSFDELTALSDEVMARIQDVDGIETIGALAGGDSSNMMSAMGNSASSVSMYLVLEEDTKRSSSSICKEVEKLTKDMNCEITTSSSASGLDSMMGSGISIEIKGPDLDELQTLAAQVAEITEKTKGTLKVEDGLDDTTPSFTIVVDKEKAAKYGLTVAQVYQIVYKEMASTQSSTTISTDLSDYAVYVQSEEQSDVTIDDIKNLKCAYTDNEGNEKKIALSKIAAFNEGVSLNSISRDAQTRYMNVTADVDEGYNVTLLSNKIQKKLDKIELPEGYSIKMAGEDETINDSMEQLLLMLALAIIFIYLVMVAQFQSLLSPFIIMFTIPLAFTGGLFALFITGNDVSVVGMIGFVMLAGIIVNNGIVMVDYINQLRRNGMDKKEAIVEAGMIRLRPILMTALTTILAMSTMAIGLGSGSEMMQPMAIVTIGGLIYGTLLTLIVVPCIYDLFHRNKSMVEEQL